ncbi:MAG TPA: lactoylglutathione lyase, partial [Deltaproteobacteria bacterium]|nr:lactoylglutathione lyase [Deltaproteobacteria bacterium]
KYLHTMIRVKNLKTTLDFFINKLGMTEVRRKEVPEGEFTLIFLAATEDEPTLELTYNWKQNEPYSNGENFGHIAYGVENIYKFCEKLQNNGVTILRPPKDGKMAFVRSPDQISVELLQIGEPLPIQEPWASMKNQGTW